MIDLLILMALIINSWMPHEVDLTKIIYPETIEIRITGLKECEKGMRYYVEEVPFKDYVKGVMVNEIGYGWDRDTMKAGAIAIKNYALHQYYRGGKWGGNGIMYDCDWDMVYNPNITRPDADSAVEATWDTIILMDGEFLQTNFNAWTYGCEVTHGEGKCLAQWLAIKHGEEGKSWQEILEYAYSAYDFEIVDLKVDRFRIRNIPE